MTLIFDPWSSSKVISDGANRKPVDSTYKYSRGPTSCLSPFLRYFESKDFAVDFDPSRSSRVKFDGAKLGAGLQQAPLRHPAKFQPDRENGVRDVRYRFFFTFWPWGLTPWPKFSKGKMTYCPPMSTILPNFIALRQPTPRISVTKFLRTNKHRKRYIPACLSVCGDNNLRQKHNLVRGSNVRSGQWLRILWPSRMLGLMCCRQEFLSYRF